MIGEWFYRKGVLYVSGVRLVFESGTRKAEEYLSDDVAENLEIKNVSGFSEKMRKLTDGWRGGVYVVLTPGVTFARDLTGGVEEKEKQIKDFLNKVPVEEENVRWAIGNFSGREQAIAVDGRWVNVIFETLVRQKCWVLGVLPAEGKFSYRDKKQKVIWHGRAREAEEENKVRLEKRTGLMLKIFLLACGFLAAALGWRWYENSQKQKATVVDDVTVPTVVKELPREEIEVMIESSSMAAQLAAEVGASVSGMGFLQVNIASGEGDIKQTLVRFGSQVGAQIREDVAQVLTQFYPEVPEEEASRPGEIIIKLGETGEEEL